MSEPLDVVVLVGSLRRGSYTRSLVRAMTHLSPQGMDLDIVDIGDMPLYDQDCEFEPPPAWKSFRLRVKHAAAVLFATPEYNRSIPAALKNAIDVGSRPYGRSIWAGKPAAVISTSPGAMGGFGANHHLRQCLVFLDMPTLQMPEAYIGQVDTLLDADGRFKDDKTRDFLAGFLSTFEGWARHQIALRDGVA